MRDETLDRAVAMIRGERDESISGSKALVPNSSTAPSTMLSDTNLRNEIDAAAQEVIDAVLRAMSDGVGAGGGGGGGVFTFGDGLPLLRCRKPLSLQVLR